MSFEPTAISYPDENCGICLELLTNDVWEHQLHRFHGRCIADWVKDFPTCPTCREVVDTTSLLGYKVILKDPEDSEDSDDFEMPEEYKKFTLIAAICASSFPLYDLIFYGNPAIIGAAFWATTAIFIRRVVVPDSR